MLWSGLSQFSTQVFQFIVITILARLLSPEDFGIVGIAIVFIGFVTAVNELGLSAAIIQRKDVDETHLSTSFWASAGMAVVMSILIVLLSPYIAEFFNESLVEPVLIVSSIGLIIGSLNVVHRALLEKNLDFKYITFVEISAAFGSGIVSILLAISGKGVWSLVFGTLSGLLISVIFFWEKKIWRPSLKFSPSHFKELFGFGSHVMGAQILNTIASRTGYLIIGKLLGTISLGYYSLINTLVSFPLQKVSWTIMRVTFPAFSIIQNDKETLRTGYLKVIKYISLITFPMLAGMFAVAPEFVAVLYGEKWIPIVLPLQILTISGALVSIGAVVGTIQYSIGRADIQFKWQAINAIAMPLAVLIGSKYGLAGVAVAILIMEVLLVFAIQSITNRLIELKMYDYLKEIFPATIASIIMIICINIFHSIIYVYSVPVFYVLLMSILIGIIIYVISIMLLFNNIITEMKTLAKEIMVG